MASALCKLFFEKSVSVACSLCDSMLYYLCEGVLMVLPEPKEPKFKEGDLVILYWQDSNGEVFSDDTTPNVVVNVRRDVTGPYPIYTILHPSGMTRTRYEFELKSLTGEEPMNNITHEL